MTSSRRVIGVDESGKGDFFGPLVVAAVLVPDDQRAALTDLGVRDGKQIANRKLLALDGLIRERWPHAVAIVPPEAYNRRYKSIKNLNKLLADCHAEVIHAVTAEHEADLAVSDKFGKPELIEQALGKLRDDIELQQIVRGESVPQVAAASIVARAGFLNAMQDMSSEYGMEFPRGAAPKVDKAGREFVRLFGPDQLANVAKVHFKNFQRATKLTLF
jgi:ribonuclease HIII